MSEISTRVRDHARGDLNREDLVAFLRAFEYRPVSRPTHEDWDGYDDDGTLVELQHALLVHKVADGGAILAEVRDARS